MINLHIDVDNLWMYEQEFGISIHKDPEYIYSQALPIFLNLLRKTQSKATFMIIGKDLKLPSCQMFCRKALAAGHEIGNHTWSHPISFGKMSYKQKELEITKTHELITKVCGRTPIGFTGPGYYIDKEIVTILLNLNYIYDSSILPGFAPLLMSTYTYMIGAKNRYKTFGRNQDILSQEKPYSIKGLYQNQTILELPISVLPFVKLPMHTTFSFFFGTFYRQLILNYLKTKPKYILYLFHAIDFVDLPVKNTNHPVIPLRYSFKQRISFIQSILNSLIQANGGPLQTSKDSIKAIRH